MGDVCITDKEDVKSDKIFESKNVKRSFVGSIRNYFREYCNCSSIHGFRYFGEKRTIFERVWWLLVFLATLGTCILFIYQVYRKWERSPVIVSFATRETPIFQIPFPTVTICPESKSIQSTFNFTDVFQKSLHNISLSHNEKKYLDHVGAVCNYYEQLNYTKTEYFEEDFYEILERVTPKLNLFECSYMGQKLDCASSFKPILTDEGICYTFNMLDRSEVFSENVYHYGNFQKMDQKTYNNWSIEYGYCEKSGLNTYPRRALLSGAKNALTVNLITYKKNVDHLCKESLQGFRVMLHTPIRIPRPSQQYFRVPLNEIVIGAIQPVMITTSNAVRMYNPRKRECYFPSERKLKYFKIYSQINCRMECLTNKTLNACGCVNFFMPREPNTEICGIANRECMMDTEEALSMGDLNNRLNGTTRRRRKQWCQKETECDCLPICTDLSYDVETSQSDWDWKKWAHSLDGTLPFDEDEVHLSKLILFFKGSQFITSQRNELYGPTDFLANFGGLLGLFTGFSVLSVMEIIYFLSIRMFCNLRLYGFWAGKEN